MRKSARERLLDLQREKFKTLTINSLDDFYKLLVDGERAPEERHINPTQKEFWFSNAFARAYKGPAGCAKTSTIVADVVAHAVLEPGSKLIIARQDYNDLMDTTALRAEEILRRLPEGVLLDMNKTPPMKWWLRPVARKDEEGEIDETPSQLTFMGMKDALKGSYEFNGGCLDEADEMEEKSVLGLLGRLRHMKGTRFLDLAFNPPSEEHWLYTACTGKDAHGDVVAKPIFTLFEPQPKENIRNLPPGYYEEMSEKLPEDMRQRLVDGAWGSTFPGEPVVKQFTRMTHGRDETPYGGGTLFRFWDFGYRHPYCAFCQITKAGVLIIMAELQGHNQTAESFCADVKMFTSVNFPKAFAYVDYGDPAAKQQKDTGQTLKVLQDAGILLRTKYTPFDLSLQIMRRRFETLVLGQPAITINRRKCRILTNALWGGYHTKEDGITPFKDGYYDHSVDALRYGIWNVWGVTSSMSTTHMVDSVAYWIANQQGELR